MPSTTPPTDTLLPRARGAGPSHRGRLTAAISVAIVMLVVAVPTTHAAGIVSGKWLARVGSAGVNGTALVQLTTGATGTTYLRLKSLRRSTSYPIAIWKGACSLLATRVAALPTTKSSATGTLVRDVALSASVAQSIWAVTGSARMSIVIGSGSIRRCATFAAQALPTPPSCAAPSVCLGQSFTVDDFLLRAAAVERWSGGGLTGPWPGRVFVTVRVEVVPNPNTTPSTTLRDFLGIPAALVGPSLLNPIDPKAGVVRQPVLAPGVASGVSPLVGWLTFEVPAAIAPYVWLIPVPGLYVRLY